MPAASTSPCAAGYIDMSVGRRKRLRRRSQTASHSGPKSHDLGAAHLGASPETGRATSLTCVQGTGRGTRTHYVTRIVPLRRLKHFGQASRFATPAITSCFPTRKNRGASPKTDQARFSHRSLSARRPLPDKGKPTVRWGRKVTDQATGLMAGLPKEGRTDSPGKWWSSDRQGDHRAPSKAYSRPSRATPGWRLAPDSRLPEDHIWV